MALAPRDRIAVIVLAVIVVGAGAFFLLTRDGAEEGPAPTEVSSPAPSPGPESSPAPAEDQEKQGRPRPRRFSFFAGRDPFVPLVVAQAGGGGTGTTAPGTGQPPAGTTPPAQQPNESMTVGGKQIVLIDIFTQDGQQKVQVEVDGKTFVVASGETFAQNFQLVSIQGGCANFLFGDQSFTLCEPGERK